MVGDGFVVLRNKTGGRVPLWLLQVALSSGCFGLEVGVKVVYL